MKILKESNYSNILISFLQDNKELLENNEFDVLYEKWIKLDNFNASIVTQLLFNADIDPLPYMTYIPAWYILGIPITNLTIPNNIKEIRENAFEFCSELTNITIPDSIREIGSNAFAGCKNLTNIIIPNSITKLSASVFYDCSNLTNIILPNSIKMIGEYAFADCINLTNITIPNSVTEIKGHAFWKCKNLTNITLPKSLTKISTDVFEPTTKIIYEGSKEDWEKIYNSHFYNSDYYTNRNIEFLNK